MRSKRKLSRSPQQLQPELQQRKLVISKSSHQIESPPKMSIHRHYRKKMPQPSIEHKQQEKSVYLHVENEHLRTDLECYPLHKKYQYYENTLEAVKKDFIVISKIEEFYEQYNKNYNEIYAKACSVHWIIISNAINKQTVEEEFNITYQPITFSFLGTLSAAVNYLNFPKRQSLSFIDLSFFRKIVNFEACINKFGSVLEDTRQVISLKKILQNELWLISHQDLTYLPKQHSKFYFIDSTNVVYGQLCLQTQQSNMIFVIIEKHEEILKLSGIQTIQDHLQPEMIKKNLLLSIHPRYCQKILEEQLIIDEIIYCLIGFPDKIKKELSKHLRWTCSFQQSIALRNRSLFHIYYEEKDPSNVLGYEFNQDNKLENEYYRISNHSKAYKKLGDSFQQIKIKKENVQILVLNLTSKQLIQEIQLFTTVQTQQIQNTMFMPLNNDKHTLLVGTLQKDQRKLFTNKNNLTIIDPKECDNNSIVILNQILLSLQSLSKKDDSLAFLDVSERLLSFNVHLQEFQDEPIYITKTLDEFDQTLQTLQENCNHLIVMKILDYNQERQIKVSEIQKKKHVSFEIYLEYGSQFIIRNKSKYTFLKRQELISKVKNMSEQSRAVLQLSRKKQMSTFSSIFQQNLQQQMFSQINKNNYYFNRDCQSSPTLRDHYQELLIVIPKTVPNHSLFNRSNQTYSLLLYSNIEQVHYLTRHLTKSYYAVIIVGDTQNIRNLENGVKSNYQIIKATQLSQKEVRDNIDRAVLNHGFPKNNGITIKQKRQSQAIVLFNSYETLQARLITQIRYLFKQSKVIAMQRSEFKELKQQFNIVQRLTIYQLESVEFNSSKKLRNIIDLLKVYMSASMNSLQFTAQNIQFSERQIVIREYFLRQKNEKLKGRLSQIRLARSLSPKAKSYKGKENVSETGLSILQSCLVHQRGKRDTFSKRNELISLIFCNMNKGNTLVIILSEEQLKVYEDLINEKTLGIIWIVITTSKKNLIIQQRHIVFCFIDQVQTVLEEIASKFRIFKNRKIEIQTKKEEESNINSISVRKYNQLTEFSEQNLQDLEPRVSFVENESQKVISIEQLDQGILLLKNERNSMKCLTFFQPKLDSLIQTPSNRKQCIKEEILILVHTRNRMFIQNCLTLLKEQSCTIVTLHSLSHLLCYAQIAKTLIVLEKRDQLKIPGAIMLAPHDIAIDYSTKLGTFIEVLREEK